MIMKTETEYPEELFTVVKRKRTKRRRTSSSTFLDAAAATSSTSSGGACFAGENPSPVSSGEISGSITDDEDEDIANCLILLAQSCSSERPNKPIAAGDSAVAAVYECTTCNRLFPTFQALGGHRASHKKPKAKSPAPPVLMDGDQIQHNKLEMKIIAPMNKIHECSICGSQFSSGQALGGHMRRHRTPATTTPVGITTDSSSGEVFCESENREKSILELDLNLPAPEEDRRELEFQFTTNNPHLAFSATALVGCNY